MTKTEIAKEFIEQCYGSLEQGETKPSITQIKEALRKAYPEEFLTYKSADNAVQYATKGRKKDTDNKSINILVIGDLHAPFIKTGYLEFCKNIYKKYNCSEVVFTGDILDNHFSSFHETDADGLSAIDELNKARYIINKFHESFPIAKVCIGNHDCYDEETEILTENGWIKGVDLEYGTRLGTMNLKNGAFEWQYPFDIIKKRYIGELISIKDSQNIDLVVTPSHRVVYAEKENPVDGREYKTAPAVKLSQGYKYFPLSCENSNKGINYTDDEIRLLAWIASDGSIIEKTGSFILYQSKVSGINKIENILNSIGIEYRKSVRTRDIKHVCGKELIKSPLPTNDYRFYFDKLYHIYKDKYILPRELWMMNEHQFNVFIESFIDGDGSRKYFRNGTSKQGCMIYGIKPMIDQLQSLCVANNCSSSISEYRDGDFRLNIHKGHKNCGLFLHKNTLIEYDGLVWCASVENTTLVVRRKGKAFISGNCIPNRKAFAAGLSTSWIRTIDEVLDVQGWVFAEEFVINGVLYTHGECRKARLRAIQEFTSVVQGHYHSESYYEVFVSESRMIFALQVGSGVDRHSYAMAYGKHFKKPQINVGVVMDSGRWAILEHMKL